MEMELLIYSPKKIPNLSSALIQVKLYSMITLHLLLREEDLPDTQTRFLMISQNQIHFLEPVIAAVEIIDDSQVRNGFNYQIVFEDTGLTDITANWSLLDLQTPDTVFVPLANQTYIVNPNDSIPLPAGTDTVIVNGSKVAVTGQVLL